MTDVSRRAALGAFGVGAVGVGLGAGVLIDHRSGSTASEATTAADRSATVASWVSTRGDRYYIGHRGSGDIYPEHSMEAYAGAVAGGARCLELSVAITSDGVLICMHDLTYDRTTSAEGTIGAMPSTVLRGIHLSAPQLGPAWSMPPVPQVAFLEDVLRAFGGRLVLCIEAKDDAAYPAIMAAVQAHGLQRSVVVKAPYDSPRLAQAKRAGYPVFAYFGAASDVSPERISTLAASLDPKADYLIVPIGTMNSLVRQAVATGIPVWAFPAHRRSDAARYFALGCRGIICSSLKYVSTAAPTATADTWAFGAVAPGEMTQDPGSAALAPVWSGDELHLGVQGTQHFLTLGQFCPLENAGGNYSVDVEASWPTLPSATSENLTLAFGHADDAYYQHRSGLGNGYHALLRADGRLELYRHQDGKPDGVSLAAPVQTAAPTAGQWMKFRLAVTPTQITWSRVDAGAAGSTASAGAAAVSAVSTGDRTYRGGYLHIGRSSTDGVLAFRAFTVS